MIHSSIDRIIEAINDGGEHPSGCGLQKLSKSFRKGATPSSDWRASRAATSLGASDDIEPLARAPGATSLPIRG